MIFLKNASLTQRQHFSPDEGDMKLKCTASIGTIYWKVNEKSAEGLKSKRDSSSNYFVHDGNPPPPGMYLLIYLLTYCISHQL